MMRLLPLLLLLALAACSTAPQRPATSDPQQTWAQHRTQLNALHAWQLDGRLAIQADDEGWQFTISWHQMQETYAINLVAPLGQGGVRLNGDNRSVTLATSDGRSASAEDPDQLLEEVLGWRVPVSALRYWVLGIPAPGEASIQLDDYGRLSQLEQAGWTIRFPDYLQLDGLELPKRVFVENHRASVRLVITGWELPPANARDAG